MKYIFNLSFFLISTTVFTQNLSLDSHTARAVVIGISDYQNLPETSTTKGALIDLKYTHNDARVFKQFLETEELSGGQWDIQSFVNDQATTHAVDNALTGILTRANQRDLIFHGNRPSEAAVG